MLSKASIVGKWLGQIRFRKITCCGMEDRLMEWEGDREISYKLFAMIRAWTITMERRREIWEILKKCVRCWLLWRLGVGSGRSQAYILALVTGQIYHFQTEVMIILGMLHLRSHLKTSSRLTGFEDKTFKRESTINYQWLGSKRNLDERSSRESVKNGKRWRPSVGLATFKHSPNFLLRETL